MQPHRQQPTRLPCPWDSPGKNTGVGCHFLLQCMKVKSESEVTQSCPTLSDPMDYSPPGSSIHGIFQARVLEWGAIAFSREGAKTSLYWVWIQLQQAPWRPWLQFMKQETLRTCLQPHCQSGQGSKKAQPTCCVLQGNHLISLSLSLCISKSSAPQITQDNGWVDAVWSGNGWGSTL